MDWEKLYQRFEASKETSYDYDEASSDTDFDNNSNNSLFETKSDGAMPVGNVDNTDCMQICGKYIVSQVKSGLMIVDQHRAHSRVLMERFLKQMSCRSSISQRVMFPETFQLSVSQQILLENIQDELEDVGFSLSNLGGNDWAINGVPAGVEGVDMKDLLLQVIDAVSNGGKAIANRIQEHIASVVAEKAAIPYGRTLTHQEMETLLSELLQLETPNYTHDGKTIINVLTTDSINKMF